MLLLRLVGWFLLRLAERRLSGLLFQEPPRRTREDGAGQAPGRDAERMRGPETEDKLPSNIMERRVARRRESVI